MPNQSSPDAIVKELQTEIKSISRSSRFIDWRESSDFSRRLAYILSSVENSLLPDYAKHSIRILDAFLSQGEKVMNRCDDSNGSIGDEFRYAVTLWGKAWNSLPDFDGNVLAERIWHYLLTNDFGLTDEIIPACTEALQRQGLDELETLVKANQHQVKREYLILHALRDIAILRQSPEALRAVFQLTGHRETPSDQLDIARLLIKCGRHQEAISLLETIDDTSHYGRDSLDLLIELHDLEGYKEAAQKLRWRGFVTRSNLDYYQAYIDHLVSDTDKQQARTDAIAFALNNTNLITSITMLNDLKQPDEAALALRNQYESLDGLHYNSLKKIAKHFIKVDYPLEATLIYRRLAESILQRAQSKYYDYAIGYLKKSKEIGVDVQSWLGYSTTEEYFNLLRNEHARKPAFMKVFSLIDN